jgi:putative peptidase family M23/M37
LRTALIGILLLWLTGCASLFGTPETVTVEKGDTLYSISKRYDMPLRDLIDANGLKPPYTLKVGQVLRLPASTYHIVSRGDTLYSISRQYNVNIADLKRINGLSYPYTLAVGQKVMLAGSARGSSATAANKTPKRMYTVRSAPRKAASRPARSSYTVAKNRKSKFSWPVRGAIVSKFGTIGKGRANDGINIKAARGTAVKAADAGTVAYAGNELKGFGNLILVRHNDGWITAYAHNDRLLVKKGQKVRRGEKIATVGATGGVNSPQLHFEIRAGKKAVNPVAYLP